MKIHYFFRHPKVGHSIHRVFRTIIEEIGKSNIVEIIEMPKKGSKPNDVLKNNIFTYKKRSKNTIHHVTGHIHDVLLALIGVKTVLTIHDLVFLDNVKNPIKKFIKWFLWLYIPVKIANEVVCISNQTKKNILTKIKSNKLNVIYNPIDPIFEYVENKFNKEKPVILHIGTGWNKNLKKSIEALNNISCHLRIIGNLKKEQVVLLEKYNIEYSNATNLTDQEIKEEYINCDIVNFPSLYEGFGMPIIEGQKTGRIVITSEIEPMIEVSDNAVAFIDPNDENSLKNMYLKCINNDEFRCEVIKKGLVNAERFSVTNIANQYIKLYKNLIER
ncbi:glycosyltransferase [Cellulophaga baltica]|uniref:glycosyltransferase n=1 Tax=Cellulophaga TaxID=104264 RepID=UPI001C066A0F|nr:MULTISPECIES: glycosyltransferase [Cellulophaga]MBU2995647.1 glycosyltransferase [Cellulophaga baltica]MDO6767041.1 glycosyltransferase [Cellulophaga sp. 1_MG-2023]